MERAVGAAGVPASTVPGPASILDQILKGRFIAVIQQVTGSLPAKDIAGGIAPWQARVILIPC